MREKQRKREHKSERITLATHTHTPANFHNILDAIFFSYFSFATYATQFRLEKKYENCANQQSVSTIYDAILANRTS